MLPYSIALLVVSITVAYLIKNGALRSQRRSVRVTAWILGAVMCGLISLIHFKRYVRFEEASLMTLDGIGAMFWAGVSAVVVAIFLYLEYGMPKQR